ncbi:MAG: penicillin-binding protein 2 [Clostridia bacterium]|nr:penicillin-binding protein 2 [Clostridia bacterium]
MSLEKAFDSQLYSDKKANAVFSVDGAGKVLFGDGIKIENDTSVIADGIVTTIDINIQLIAEKVSESIEKGAVVIADAEKGKIRAMVSKPDYDPTQIAGYLNTENSPLYNRCISAYNVGSAFKPCVAAAAIETNKAGYNLTCTGYELITDRRFNCHKKDGHGTVNLKAALSLSCNVFFYNMALRLGGNSLYSMAASLGFGQRLKLAQGYYTAAGNLTSRSALSNEAELANLSIGQGRLLLSPVSMLTLYCAIANDGSYNIPSVVEGVLKDGKYTATEKSAPTRVMSEDTALKLRKYLEGVVSDGTGTAAKPTNTTAAGKTATAQTGKYKNGVEITHSWFCGFFPADTPKYVVIVMSEGGTGTAGVFAKIADKIIEASL